MKEDLLISHCITRFLTSSYKGANLNKLSPKVIVSLVPIENTCRRTLAQYNLQIILENSKIHLKYVQCVKPSVKYLCECQSTEDYRVVKFIAGFRYCVHMKQWKPCWANLG